MDCAKVGVFEESDKVGFSCFLKGQDSRALESEFSFVFMSDFPDKSLEWEFSDQKVSALLVFSDFSEGNCSGSETMWFLHASGGWGGFSGGLVSELFSWGFRTG